MKKTVLLLGKITDKHAKVLDNLKNQELIEKTYVIPYTGPSSLLDFLGFSKSETNQAVQKARTIRDFVIVKGQIHTDHFLRPVIELNKVLGGDRLIHCAIFKNTKTNKTFILTDGACNIKLSGDMETTMKAISYATELHVRCVDEKAREVYVSLLSAGGESNENTSPGLYEFWKNKHHLFPEGQLRIEQLDVALNANIRESKGIKGPTSNIVVVDDINTGNAIWKSLTALNSDWICGGILMGSKLPIVLNSREDTAESLEYSIKSSLGL